MVWDAYGDGFGDGYMETALETAKYGDGELKWSERRGVERENIVESST